MVYDGVHVGVECDDAADVDVVGAESVECGKLDDIDGADVDGAGDDGGHVGVECDDFGDVDVDGACG